MSVQFCSQCGTRLEPNARFCTACGTAVSAPTSTSSTQRLEKKPFPWPLALLMVGFFLIAAGAGYSLLSSRANEVTDLPAALDTAGLPFPEIARISAEETKVRVDGGTAVVVDVRSAEEYAVAHIPGAVSIPVGDIQARSGELNPNAEIITYCT